MRPAGRAERDEDGAATLDPALGDALADTMTGGDALAAAVLVRVPSGVAENVADGEGEKNVTFVTLRKGLSVSNTDTA